MAEACRTVVETNQRIIRVNQEKRSRRRKEADRICSDVATQTPPSHVGGYALDKTRCGCSCFEHLDEGFLWNIHRPEGFHAFFAFFLLLQEFAFARDIPAIAFGGNILA